MFGATIDSHVYEFAAETKEFEMSMIGELTYFLGLQVNNMMRECLCPNSSMPRIL